MAIKYELTKELETGIGIPFHYYTRRFRIFIQPSGFKKPSHDKECKGRFGKRCHGKLVRVHSRTFGHDDTGTARGAVPIP